MDIKYKIIFGYETERNLTIGADELEKAYGVFLGGGRAVFRNGAIDGKYIQAIMPDFHATMGWTPGYRLTADDFAELSSKGIDRKARDMQNDVKERVQLRLSGNDPKLLS